MNFILPEPAQRCSSGIRKPLLSTLPKAKNMMLGRTPTAMCSWMVKSDKLQGL